MGRNLPKASTEADTDRARERQRPEAEEESPTQAAEPKPLNRRERRALEHARRESGGTPETPVLETRVDTGERHETRAKTTESRDTSRSERAHKMESRPARRGEHAPTEGREGTRGDRTRAPERSDTGPQTKSRGERTREVESSGDFQREPRRRQGGDEDVETYRIEVGHEHGVKPNNIVGAIANEVGLEGRHIGRVVIREDHSFVDLPAGMPKEVFRQLQKVRVAGQPLQISRALKTHVEKLRRERPSTARFKGKPQSGAHRSRRK